LVLGLWLNAMLCFGQLSFEWYNKDKGLLERINFQTGNYESLKVNKDNTFKVQSKLKFYGVKLVDILPNYEVNVFPKGRNRILTVPGTGQVYELDSENKFFKRLDKTIHRGYNFKALQFIENDTLYSLGGTGFWQSNSILTYFDPSYSEWEERLTKGKKPYGIYLNSSGINNGKVFVIDILRHLDNNVSQENTQIFQLDINSKTWSNLGELNKVLLTNNEINSQDFQWSNGHLFFLHSREPIFADVKTNRVFKYNGSRNGFLSYKGRVYISKGWVYTFRNDGKITLDSIRYSELQRNSILLGQLYLTYSKFYNLNGYFLLIALLVIVTALIVAYKIRIRRKVDKENSISASRPKYLDKLLHVYRTNGPDYLITTEELSRIIECDSMAFDTQRQYRSKFISSINTYSLDNFGIADAIFRINHDSDKRFIHYGIKKELFALIDDILV